MSTEQNALIWSLENMGFMYIHTLGGLIEAVKDTDKVGAPERYGSNCKCWLLIKKVADGGITVSLM